MGGYAGDMAGQRAAAQTALLPVDNRQVEPLKEKCGQLLGRKLGFHWSELELAVQNVVDYYCTDDRSTPFLERGLERLSELRAGTPLRAANAHELGRCLEVYSIIENAEMVMRASLARTETRLRPARFTRVEYPNQDDANFFCFLDQRLSGGQATFSKVALK